MWPRTGVGFQCRVWASTERWSAAAGRRPTTALLLLLICPGHQITTLLTPPPPRALFPELLDCIKGFYEANCSQCGRFFLGRFTLFTGTKVFVWLMSRSAASPGEVQWWTTHGHGSGLGMAGSVRRTRAVTAADSGDQITQNPRPNSRI